MNMQNLSEGKKPLENNRVIYKKNQLAATSLNVLTLPDRLVTIVLFPMMGLVVVYFMIYREIKFDLSMKMKNIGILLTLGTPKKLIFQLFVMKNMILILLSSILAGIIYKFILFEWYIREYVSFKWLSVIILLYVVVGFISLMVAMKKIKKRLWDFPIQEILSKKEQ